MEKLVMKNQVYLHDTEFPLGLSILLQYYRFWKYLFLKVPYQNLQLEESLDSQSKQQGLLL